MFTPLQCTVLLMTFTGLHIIHGQLPRQIKHNTNHVLTQKGSINYGEQMNKFALTVYKQYNLPFNMDMTSSENNLPNTPIHDVLPTKQRNKSIILHVLKHNIASQSQVDQTSGSDDGSRYRRDSQTMTPNTTVKNAQDMTTTLHTSGRTAYILVISKIKTQTFKK